MNVIAKPRLKVFWQLHPPAQIPLTIWWEHMRRTRYENFNVLAARFPNADQVGHYTIFNIGGNKYRLVVKIIYRSQRIYIDRILIHSDYDFWSKEHLKILKRS